MSDDELELVSGSGNLWRDSGFADAEIRQAKADLAAAIIGVMDRKKLSAAKAGERTAFTAADFSRVRNADLGRFTIDRLIRMLMALDPRQGVKVAITRAQSKAKRETVAV